MGRQITGHDYIVGHQRGVEHLLEVGGVDAFFSPPVQRLHYLPNRRPVQGWSAQRGHSHAQLVQGGSGGWRIQATNSVRVDASKQGAGPLRWGSAASEPLRCWRCNSLATNETELSSHRTERAAGLHTRRRDTST